MLRFLFVNATFNVGIGKEDIQEPVLLAEDWYQAEITREPYEDKNAAWKTAGEDLEIDEAYSINEKVGKNIVINTKLISDIPEAHGRTFTKWLPLPNKFDEGQYMNDGQPRPDWKADIIHKWAEAFGGGSDGAEASLGKGQKAMIYIVVGKDMDEETDINQISMNVDPRNLDIGKSGLEGEEVFEEGLL